MLRRRGSVSPVAPMAGASHSSLLHWHLHSHPGTMQGGWAAAHTDQAATWSTQPPLPASWRPAGLTLTAGRSAAWLASCAVAVPSGVPGMTISSSESATPSEEPLSCLGGSCARSAATLGCMQVTATIGSASGTATLQEHVSAWTGQQRVLGHSGTCLPAAIKHCSTTCLSAVLRHGSQELHCTSACRPVPPVHWLSPVTTSPGATCRLRPWWRTARPAPSVSGGGWRPPWPPAARSAGLHPAACPAHPVPAPWQRSGQPCLPLCA